MMGLLLKINSFVNNLNHRRYFYLMVISTIIHIFMSFYFDTHLGIDGYIYKRVALNIFNSNSLLACGTLEGAYWPPLFPICLSLFFKVFGDVKNLFFIMNITLLLGITIFSYSFLKIIFDKITARWATFFFYNSLICFNFVHYYKYEILSAFLVNFSVYLLFSINKNKVANIAFSGLFFGLSVLTNGRILCLLPAFIFLIYKNDLLTVKYKRYLNIAIFSIAILLTITPWSIRNYNCYHKIIPISTNGGINFYIGFNPKANGRFISQTEFEPPFDKIDRTDSKQFIEGGFDYIKEYPFQSILLIFKKIYLLWRIHYFDSVFFLPFFYIGIFLLKKFSNYKNYNHIKFIQYIVVSFTIFHAIFFSRYYYIIPILPFVYAVAVSTQKYFLNKITISS